MREAGIEAPSIPVTVLTGFLGAGKTTLLNRVLTGAHGRRYLVIINEFGEIGIDHDLVVSSDETLIEMNNGCICCTVRDDLIKILRQTLGRSETFDGVLIETTGLADPAPVIQTFFVDPELADRFRLDAVVTVVDAHHVLDQLQSADEAVEQVALADIIVLNKTDLVDATRMAEVTARIRTLNPIARVEGAERCAVDLARILEQRAFDLERLVAAEPDFLTSDHAHAHDEAIASVSLTSDRAMDRDRFIGWMTDLLQSRGRDILRCKGIIDMADSGSPFAVQGVHMLLDGDYQRPWVRGVPRRSRLVFIGRDLDAAGLDAAFQACAA